MDTRELSAADPERIVTRVNIGCGITPTKGWINFDNSFAIKLSAFPVLVAILYRARLLNRPQFAYVEFCRANKIRWADATKKIELPSNSVDLIYSSHMLEHLDRNEAAQFLAEAKRLLVRGGTIRLAVPDVRQQALKYIDDGDADVFVESLFTCVPKPRTLLERLEALLIGARHHQWMYDSRSLCKLLRTAGFVEPRSFPPGDTSIATPGNLDLCERADESIYVEATKA